MNCFKISTFSNRGFLALLGGQGISNLGDSISSVALPILVLSITGSGLLMDLVGALEVAPLFMIGLPIGVWVDRWNRNIVMPSADFGETALLSMIPRIVAPEEPGHANGYFEAVESASYASGPSIHRNEKLDDMK